MVQLIPQGPPAASRSLKPLLPFKSCIHSFHTKNYAKCWGRGDKSRIYALRRLCPIQEQPRAVSSGAKKEGGWDPSFGHQLPQPLPISLPRASTPASGVKGCFPLKYEDWLQPFGQSSSTLPTPCVAVPLWHPSGKKVVRGG